MKQEYNFGRAFVEHWRYNWGRNCIYALYFVLLLFLVLQGMFIADMVIADCQVSSVMKKRMREQLSVKEWASIRAEAGFCPTLFFYQSDDGKNGCVRGNTDHIRGIKISFGDCG